jgi:hypothetical protein
METMPFLVLTERDTREEEERRRKREGGWLKYRY